MTRSDGVPVNAVYGLTSMLMRLLEKTSADHIAVVFDAARHTFRHDLYRAYKAHRPPPPEALVLQFSLIRESVRALNIASVEQEGYEADDLIATYARQAVAQGANVTILSADKDLMQLVRPGVRLWDPLKRCLIGPDQVRQKFGVEPHQVADVQALAGDSTDNVPGVPGIGMKIAAGLITLFGNLENLLARTGEITQSKRRQILIDHAEMARLSRALVQLKDDTPIVTPLTALMTQPLDPKAVRVFLRAQAFSSLLSRFERSLQQPTTTTQHVSTPTAAAASQAYSLLQNLGDLDQWLSKIHTAPIVAVRAKIDCLDSRPTHLIGVSLAVGTGEACYIPLGHKLSSAAGERVGSEIQMPIAEALERLRQTVLENRSVLKVGHNIKFDLHVFHIAGQRMLGQPINISPIDDIMVLSYVLGPPGTGHSMDELARKHLGLTTISHKAVCHQDRPQMAFDRVPLDQACRDAAEDADITRRLHILFRERLLAEHMVTVHETMDRPLVPILVAMEQTGILVEEAALQRLSTDFAMRMTMLETAIYHLAGQRFNLSSPRQLGEILFERMRFPGGKKSPKSGAYTTDATTLEFLAAKGHNLPALVLHWRQLAKLRSTYTESLLSRRDRTTGRLHTSFVQTATATGRLSSNDPNLQNIPARTADGRRIRHAFIAPPDHVLLSADYSQIELRLLAHVADVRALKEAFSANADIHAVTASQVFGVPIATVTPLLRRRAKAINFGIIYGISPFGLATQLHLSQSKARVIIEAYFERYPEIRHYMERTKTQARQQGFVTTFLGRKCQAFGINARHANSRGVAERAAINAPIQGGAADIIKRAMIRLPGALAEASLNARMLLQVHDELVFEVPKTEIIHTTLLIRSVMEKAATLSVPLVVEIGTGDNWAEAH